MLTKYNERCPENEKTITVRERAKWYNSELNEVKKTKKKNGIQVEKK